MRKVVIIVIAAIVLLYAAGTATYVGVFHAERDTGTVIVGVAPGLEGDATLLAGAFVAEAADRKVVVVDPSGAEILTVESGQEVGSLPAPGTSSAAASAPADAGSSLAALLKDGTVDFALAGGDAVALLDKWLIPAEAACFRHADLLALPFPSARQAVTLEQAQTMVAGLKAGGTSPWPGEAVELIGLGDRNPGRQLLVVGDVYPTLATVMDGSYPLYSEVRFGERGPRGFLALLSKLPFVRSWAQANSPVVEEFKTWLSSDDAKAAFYGAATEIKITAVGDVMLARKTGREIDQFGLDYPFQYTGAQLASADITYCNLEAPLGTTGTMIPGKEIWLRGKPEYVECLKKAGVDVVNLANNHVLDYDSPCLLETFSILDGAGIAYEGAGTNVTTAREPAIIEAGGLKVAFLGYTEYADPGLFWSFSYRRTFLASETEPGCNPLDMAMIAEDIAAVKPQVDLVVVAFHWGWEDITYPQAYNPNNNCEAIARQVIDLGANIILGGHPHAQQGYEAYHGGLIAYSLGNFVNDQNKVTQKEAVILEMQVGPEGVLSSRLTPCWIQSTEPNYMQGAEAERMYEKLEEISVGFRDHQ